VEALKATAHTLPYDWAALGKHRMYGAPLDRGSSPRSRCRRSSPTAPKSPAVLQEGSRALAQVLSNAELRELEGISHNLKMNVLAPVLAEFFTGEKDAAAPSKARPATAR